VNVVTQHWELKLLALGFSFALWLFVMTSEKSDLILSAPLEFEQVPAGMVVAGERPESVDIQLHGLRGTLSRLAPDQIRARVNLSGVSPGESTIRLLPEQVAVPVGVTVIRVTPSRIRVTVQTGSSSRRAPAREAFRG